MTILIEQLHDLSTINLAPIIKASRQENYEFIDRLVAEWQSGDNRFDKHGEVLFIALSQQDTVGICGLNIDPYVDDDSCGRVRHLYVLPDYRRYGIGQQLVERVIQQAQDHFTRLNLRTGNPAADKLYRQLSFDIAIENPTCTHTLLLDKF